jgi:hypothetical protein
VAAKLLTIGEFARLSRLSPKALRLYDELGLLRPCRVDEWSGYRYYAPSQLERARLVGWLRQPLSPSPAASGAAAAPLAIRYAAASDIGRVRARNQDAGHAGPRLIAVADGYGPVGDRASAAAVDALRHLEAPNVVPADRLARPLGDPVDDRQRPADR